MFGKRIFQSELYIEDRILNVLLTITYRQLVIIAISSIGSSILLAALLWNKIPHHLIFAWLAINTTGLVVIPIVVSASFFKTGTRNLKKSSERLKITGALGALSFGLAGIFLYVPNSIEYQMYLLLIISVGATLATAMTLFYPPVFYLLIFPLLAPYAVRSTMEGSFFNIVIGLGAIPLFVFTLVFFHSSVHRYLLDAIRLRFEKTDLAEELDKQKQKAEQANIDKSRFLAAASHDLRQPLHAQGLYAADLRYRIKDLDTLKVLSKLEKSIDTMQNLFNELLDLSKLDAHTVKPDIAPFAIRDIFNEIKLDFNEPSHSKGLELHILDSNLIILSDKILLTRILKNLASNAIRYTHKGKILIGCRRLKDSARIEVWDTGVGIPQHAQTSIFQEYFQLANPERNRDKGIGLGLAIVSRLAKLLNHKIEVRSVFNKGSVFSIEVKTDHTIGNTPKALPNQPISRYAPNKNEPQKAVLIIDDDSTVLDSMGNLIRTWNWNVYTAHSSKEALQHLHENVHLNLIITDFRLQHSESGLNAIEKIHLHIKKTIPAFIITGETSPKELKQLENCGYEVLYKPVSPAKLRALLNYFSSMSSGDLS